MLAERIGITLDGVKYHLARLRAAGVIQAALACVALGNVEKST